MRRALIPAKRSNSYDKRDILNSNVGPGKSSSHDIDDRIHNALLEELCADYGVTDSSYIDFLSFDIPADRVESGQLPSDLQQLGEIVSFGTVKPKTESLRSVSEGIHGASSIHGVGVTTAKTTPAIQMKISDDVASPTISSSCEESKPADGAGEALSDFPPAVHSTTGCASAKTDTDTSGIVEEHTQQPPNKSDSFVETRYKDVLTPSTLVPDEQSSSTVHLSRDLPDRNDSTASSPKHIAKKARLIASGGDLLDDVKKSYAFVCGADMFAPPARPVLSHPRLHTPVGSQFDLVQYSQKAPGYGTRASRDGHENPFDSSTQNPSNVQQSVSDKSYGTRSLPSANFSSSTPVKGFRQHYSHEWQTVPASSLDTPYHTNVMHHANIIGSGTVDYGPTGGKFMQGHCSITGTGSTGTDIHRSVPYTGGVQHARTAEFPAHVDQNRLNYQSVNCSPQSAVDQSARSYGYPIGPYGGSYEHVGRQSGPRHKESYCSPLASPYRGLPSHASNASIQHRMVTANESRNIYPSGDLYPAQNTHTANVNTADYNEQVDRSLPASPVRYRVSRSVTPRFVPSYSRQTGIENYIPECSNGNLQYTYHESSTVPGQMPLVMESGMQPSAINPGNQNSGTIHGVPTQNEFSFGRTSTDVYRYAEQKGNFPRSPASDHSAVNPVTPRCGFMLPDAELSYGASSSSLLSGQAAENGCLGFVRHLIGSGSGPYRSHPLFPLLRDLVIADMNFEAPSFPYPLIAGLPRSFDRLISNYFSCTAHKLNLASADPSVDAIVMDALRYAHSALLGNWLILSNLYSSK